MSIEMRGLKWCVYHHVINGQIIYVGSGVLSRAFSPSPRNATWKRVAKEAGIVDVRIVARFSDSQAALRHERQEIARHLPIANESMRPIFGPEYKLPEGFNGYLKKDGTPMKSFSSKGVRGVFRWCYHCNRWAEGRTEAAHLKECKQYQLREQAK